VGTIPGEGVREIRYLASASLTEAYWRTVAARPSQDDEHSSRLSATLRDSRREKDTAPFARKELGTRTTDRTSACTCSEQPCRDSGSAKTVAIAHRKRSVMAMTPTVKLLTRAKSHPPRSARETPSYDLGGESRSDGGRRRRLGGEGSPARSKAAFVLRQSASVWTCFRRSHLSRMRVSQTPR